MGAKDKNSLLELLLKDSHIVHWVLQAFPYQAQMTDGSLAGGHWVRGQREGRGTLISPNLEARGVAMIQVFFR